MNFERRQDRRAVLLASTAALGAGGEARIFPVDGDPSLVAKIYHMPTRERAAKLEAMLANPPDDPTAVQGHISIAWPLDLLLDPRGGAPVGFLMPFARDAKRVFFLFNPGTRKRHCPLFNYKYLMTAAFNLAWAVAALHDRGYVIGDVNESNILVTDTALVTLVDTDSFQVRDASNGTVFRCPVFRPEYTPPELQWQLLRGTDLAQIDRQPEHDCFGLAVLIFQLLMEGTHPFGGVFIRAGEPPPYEESIRQGHFTYGGARTVPYRRMPNAPPFELLDPQLRNLLFDCFDRGHGNPSARPSARQWRDGLSAALGRMETCRVNTQHWYGPHLTACPWCERMAQFGGRDPFPSLAVPVPPRPVRSRRRPAPSPVPPPPPIAAPLPVPAPTQPGRWVRVVASSAAAVLAACALNPPWAVHAGLTALVFGLLAWWLAAKAGRRRWIPQAASGLSLAVLLVHGALGLWTRVVPVSRFPSPETGQTTAPPPAVAAPPAAPATKTAPESASQTPSQPAPPVPDPAATLTKIRVEAEQHVSRSRTLYAETRFREALQQCDLALKLDPNNRQAQQLRNQIAATLSKITTELEQHLSRARTLYEETRFREALRECDLALKLQPNNQQAQQVRNQIAATLKILEGQE